MFIKKKSLFIGVDKDKMKLIKTREESIQLTIWRVRSD